MEIERSTNSDRVVENHQHINKTILWDCSLCTPIPWIILGCIVACILYAAHSFFVHGLDNEYYPCNEWNAIEYEWKIDNCDIYRSLNELTNNDTWILCNMFINVNQLHNPQYNWFQTIDNDNFTYSVNSNTNNNIRRLRNWPSSEGPIWRT